jgi:hypothetical protein
MSTLATESSGLTTVDPITGTVSGPSSSSGDTTSGAVETSTTSSSSSAASSSGSSTTGSTTGEPVEPPHLAGRWILRDADGVAIDAFVEPSCRTSLSNCVIPPVGHVGPIAPQCIRVVWLGDEFLDVRYASETGRAEECVAQGALPAFPGSYPTPDCAPPGYMFPSEGTEDAELWTRRLAVLDDDTVLYEANEHPSLDIFPAYGWSGECVQNPLLGGNDLVPWLPLPGWVADALPNPPYVLEWETT